MRTQTSLQLPVHHLEEIRPGITPSPTLTAVHMRVVTERLEAQARLEVVPPGSSEVGRAVKIFSSAATRLILLQMYDESRETVSGQSGVGIQLLTEQEGHVGHLNIYFTSSRD